MIELNLAVAIGISAFLLGGICGYGIRATISARRQASDRRRRLCYAVLSHLSLSHQRSGPLKGVNAVQI